MGMGHGQRQKRSCLRCRKAFVPTGSNCKRCGPCRRAHHLESCKARWHTTYEKKGYNQSGPRNNAWKGGSSPQYYQQVAFSAHGTDCLRCGKPAVLVHHKDGNRKNSQPNNLEVLCKRCHQLEHHCTEHLPERVVFKERECAKCGSGYQPSGPRSKYCVACGGKRSKV